MIKVVTILGAGTMGHGIAHAAMAGGFETRLFDVSGEMLDRARKLDRPDRPLERRAGQQAR